MEYTYLAVFIGLCVLTVAHGLWRPERFFEYPYFMAAVFAVFILPQAVSLVRFPAEAGPEAVSAVLLMSCLCLAACLLGYLLPPNRWIVRHAVTPVNLDKLLQVAVVFIAVSYYFDYKIAQMTDEERGGSMWSGRVTIYLFFQSLIYPGVAIALIHALQRRWLWSWLLTVAGSWIPLRAILFGGRRELAALFLLTVGLALFYQRRWVPPRAAVAAGLVFALLAIPATGSYRMALAERNFEAVRQIDLIGNFRQYLQEESILELRNAALLMDAVLLAEDYQYGGGYWDQLVIRFVPAQLLGREFKERLMFRPKSNLFAEEMEARGIEVVAGTTPTGMGDAFQQFGYFGCLFFTVLAVIFRSLWHASLQPAAVFAQLLYLQTATAAMRAVTHQTTDYLPGLLYNVVFLGAAVWYARDTTEHEPLEPRSEEAAREEDPVRPAEE